MFEKCIGSLFDKAIKKVFFSVVLKCFMFVVYRAAPPATKAHTNKHTRCQLNLQ